MLSSIFYFITYFVLSANQLITSHTYALSNQHDIIFLDSIDASKAIIDDDVEGFFQKITIAEMEIQMKRNYQEGTPKEKILEDYLTFLSKDVTSFTKEEREFTQKAFQEAFDLCQKISPDIFPNRIELIKTPAKHYGPSVYYTRENRIIIPFNELSQRAYDPFLKVMIHEIFHVYSRYNEEKRKKLYKLIGFEALDENTSLTSSPKNDSLFNRILYNPDGINYKYAITLKTNEGNSIRAIPIIYSTLFNYSTAKPNFFDYLNFNLFQIEQSTPNQYTIFTNPDGTSTLSLSNLPDFFRQIKDNTQYIIHPDEIMADNFALLVLSKKGNEQENLKRFSSEGKVLLKQVEQVLME